MATPFLTFYTPTYRRPQALARCMAKIAEQTAVDAIQHVIIPDYVGLGVGGMFQEIPKNAPIVRGEYVHILADDDELERPTVVEQLRAVARSLKNPPVLIVQARKGEDIWPWKLEGPPLEGRIDLGCTVTRRDVWLAHVHDYTDRYEADFDFLAALWQAGHPFAYVDLLFLTGAVMRGQPEAAA